MIAQVIATVGVLLLLSAFALNLAGRVRPDGTPYQLLNLVGGGLSCFGAILIGFWPFVVLEGCWAVTAGVFLVNPFSVARASRRSLRGQQPGIETERE